MPAVLKKDDCAGPAKGLCGNVPIQYGPEYANPLVAGSPSKPTLAPILSSVAPVPTQSYAPARSEGPGGISVYAVKPEASAAAPKADAPKVNSVLAPAAPLVTPAPEVAKAADGKKAMSTTTYTSAGVVYEVAIEEVDVTVTVTASDAGVYNRARRHAHVKAHARRHAERV
jgi:hypothetical protein